MIATKEHIISVIRSVAKELGRAPTSYELRRKGGISPALVKHRFGNYMAVLRAAGLEPRNTGTRLADAQLLEDWGRVVRKRKQVPSGSQYMLAGKFSLGSFIRRFQSWRLVPAAFVLAAEQSALGGDWNDVVETVRKGPIPVKRRRLVAERCATSGQAGDGGARAGRGKSKASIACADGQEVRDRYDAGGAFCQCDRCRLCAQGAAGPSGAGRSDQPAGAGARAGERNGSEHAVCHAGRQAGIHY